MSGICTKSEAHSNSEAYTPKTRWVAAFELTRCQLQAVFGGAGFIMHSFPFWDSGIEFLDFSGLSGPPSFWGTRLLLHAKTHAGHAPHVSSDGDPSRLGRRCWVHTYALETSLPDMSIGAFARPDGIQPPGGSPQQWGIYNMERGLYIYI